MPPAFHPSDPTAAMLPVMLILAAAVVGGLIYLYRKGGPAHDGVNLEVRCRHGHVFRTFWPGFVAAKARRMGGWRLQYCPEGRHLTFVEPVDRRDIEPPDGP